MEGGALIIISIYRDLKDLRVKIVDLLLDAQWRTLGQQKRKREPRTSLAAGNSFSRQLRKFL
jgi:hypothetical protein